MVLTETAYKNANDFTLSITASRTSGVGPLSVFFDILESSTFAYENQELFIEFVWDFGDEGDDYNIGKGTSVGHVYKDSGTYTVTCVAWYRNFGDNTTTYLREETVDITVSEFTGTTYYISADGSDTNDGLTMDTPWQDVYTALNNYDGENTRFLLRQGDTFELMILYICQRIQVIILHLR